MSGREWRPGDVALVTEYDPPLIALVVRKQLSSKLLWFKYADGGFDVAGPTAIGEGEVLDIAARPLVVIDPVAITGPEETGSADPVGEIARCLLRLAEWEGASTTSGTYRGQIAARLSAVFADPKFADPKPPKPEEPTGLGAVVEDVDRHLWTRANNNNEWSCECGDEVHAPWEHVKAVRVLSDGVQPEVQQP